jgi:nicotinamide-nucleotide amidase
MNTAAICTIGDEILIGQIVDTNTSYIARILNMMGIKVEVNLSIKDDKNTIISQISELCEKYDVIIVTGGLGPTKDDITKSALFELSGSKKYKENSEQLEIINAFAIKRGMPLLDINRMQASVPENCMALINEKGTAPGMFFKIERKYAPGCSLLFSMPGVPYEMEYIMQSIPSILEYELELEKIYHKTLTTFGLPESVLSNTIEEWELSLPHFVKLAYLPNPLSGIKLRLSVYGSEIDAYNIIHEEISKLKRILGNIIYGEDNDNLEKVVSGLLSSKKETLSVAESCTGGKISSLFTSIPGSSAIFKGAVIAYSNEIKIKILGVREETITKYGAVSEECAREMAEGICRVTGSSRSIAVTGIAGPDGGSDDKPVGTVWIAISDGIDTFAKKVVTTGDRLRNIERFSAEAINFLRLQLIENK